MMIISPRETEQNHFSPQMLDHADESELDARGASLRRCGEYHHHITSCSPSIAALGKNTQLKTPRKKSRHTLEIHKKSKVRSRKRIRELENNAISISPSKFRIRGNSTKSSPRLPCSLNFDCMLPTLSTNETSTIATAVDTKTKSAIATAATTTCASESLIENISSSNSCLSPAEHTTKIPCALKINHDLFSPASIGSDSVPPSPVYVKTPKMAAVRFSLDTKKHDGLCNPSLALENIVANYIHGNLISVEDLKSFCTKMDYYKHISFVRGCIKTLISSIENVTGNDQVPLLRRGGGCGFMLTCVNLEKIQQLYRVLLLFT